MSSQVKIYQHTLEARDDVLAFLDPYLPTCVVLYRRIQFGNFAPAARLLSSLSPEELSNKDGPQKHWIFAFVDRSCRPEMEVMMTASWELETPETEGSWMPQAEPLVKALFREIKAIGLPGVKEDGGPVGSVLLSGDEGGYREQLESHMSNPDIIVVGAVHEHTTKVLKKSGLIAEGFPGADIPYRKYMFDLNQESVSTTRRGLPRDFVWGKVKPQDYWLVKSRTQIPRQDRTLRLLPSLAIYPNQSMSATPAPIAWAFLWLDASLTTLHVEPAYRGLGLAKALAAKLFADGMDAFWQHNVTLESRDGGRVVQDKWAHADVATDNAASIRVCEGLGGNWNSCVYWIRVDLGKA